MMPVGLDLEIDDMDNYQDIRIELNATGHNLVRAVCVLLFRYHYRSVDAIDYCSVITIIYIYHLSDIRIAYVHIDLCAD